MKNRYVQRAILCIVLTAALCIGVIMPQMHSYAIDPIITDAQCSLTVGMAESHKEQFRDLVDETAKEVYLFKVADVDEYAQFTAAQKFAGSEELSNLVAGIYENGENYTSSQWEKMAQLASEIVKVPYLSAEDGKLDDTEAVIPEGYDAQGTIKAGESSVKISGLSTGLYLVYIRKALTTRHVYSFQPYLVSVPNNEWYGDQDGDAQTVGDSWLYDFTSVMKPKQDVRYGELEIRKNVENYNPDLGEAVFAFRVTAVLDGKVVYDDVLSLEFANGVYSAVADMIPAGSAVTVREEYSGASYELQGPGDASAAGGAAWDSGVWTLTLMPDAEDDQNPNGHIEGDYVGFINDYNNSAGWSTGVRNHYDKAGEGWRYVEGE